MEGLWIGDGKFEFDLGGLHGVSIRVERHVRSDRMERYVQWKNGTIRG